MNVAQAVVAEVPAKAGAGDAEARRHSLPSATVAMASAGVFLVLVSLLSFVPDGAPSVDPAWQLRGTLADRSGPSDQGPPAREVRRDKGPSDA